jgi:hypothetical protein
MLSYKTLVYRSVDEVLDQDQWLADKAALFDTDEIAKLCDNPLDEKLTPAHVDTFLQHVVMFHKRPILLISAAHSADFDINHRNVGLRPSLSRAQWKQLATAAMPPLTDDRMSGTTASFEVVVIPVYVPGHFVSQN